MKLITLYEILKPLEDNLRTAYKQGARVSCEIFRDLEIYEEFLTMTHPKMLCYSILAEKHGISETSVRDTVKKMGKTFFLEKNLPLHLTPNQEMKCKSGNYEEKIIPQRNQRYCKPNAGVL